MPGAVKLPKRPPNCSAAGAWIAAAHMLKRLTDRQRRGPYPCDRTLHVLGKPVGPGQWGHTTIPTIESHPHGKSRLLVLLEAITADRDQRIACGRCSREYSSEPLYRLAHRAAPPMPGEERRLECLGRTGHMNTAKECTPRSVDSRQQCRLHRGRAH